MTLIDLGLVAALGFSGGPYSKQLPTLWPSLGVEQRFKAGILLRTENTTRAEPIQANRWNPVTTAWTVEAGLDIGGARLVIGHKSEHSVGADARLEPSLESLDYVSVRYRMEYK